MFRKHFDYLLASTLVMIGIALLSKTEDIGLLSAIYLLISLFLEGWLIYFFIKHGRRLAWNRSQWSDFEAFRKSENRWLNFQVHFFTVVIFVKLFIPWVQREDDWISFGRRSSGSFSHCIIDRSSLFSRHGAIRSLQFPLKKGMRLIRSAMI